MKIFNLFCSFGVASFLLSLSHQAATAAGRLTRTSSDNNDLQALPDSSSSTAEAAAGTETRRLLATTWYEPPETSTVTTWDQARLFCEGKDKGLAGFSDYCPHQGPPGEQGGGPSPSFTAKPGDQWAPMNNHPNAWVQVGDANNHKICSRHRDLGSDPDWGTNTDKQAFEANYILCKDVPSQYLVVVQGGIKGGLFDHLQAAKDKLSSYRRGSRCIVEVRFGKVLEDPSWISGQPQPGHGVFRSEWKGPEDLQKMVAVAKDFVADPNKTGNQCWDDGTICLGVFSCGGCCNPNEWWWSKVSHACGSPP